MPQKHTALTKQNLQIYPTERLTDADDGGGLMVKDPLTGRENELFTPISDVARTIGAFNARSVHGAVRVADNIPLGGAHMIISRPPKAENVSYLLYRGVRYGEVRRDIIKRIAAYSVATIESRMTLLSTQSQGSRIVQAYQRPGEPLPLKQEQIALNGWAMEARLYAEDPANGFLPSIGRLDHFRLPDDVRIDTGVEQGGEVSQFYDPMIAKLIVHEDTREAAAERLTEAVMGELGPLKLERARFRVALEPIEGRRGPEGVETVRFQIATNAGTAFGPLDAIASGGELARFALAMKAALAGREDQRQPVMIFDEVDQGEAADLRGKLVHRDPVEDVLSCVHGSSWLGGLAGW